MCVCVCVGGGGGGRGTCVHSCMGVCVNAYEREKNGGWYIGIDYIPCSPATNEQDDLSL